MLRGIKRDTVLLVLPSRKDGEDRRVQMYDFFGPLVSQGRVC